MIIEYLFATEIGRGDEITSPHGQILTSTLIETFLQHPSISELMDIEDHPEASAANVYNVKVSFPPARS